MPISMPAMAEDVLVAAVDVEVMLLIMLDEGIDISMVDKVIDIFVVDGTDIDISAASKVQKKFQVRIRRQPNTKTERVIYIERIPAKTGAIVAPSTAVLRALVGEGRHAESALHPKKISGCILVEHVCVQNEHIFPFRVRYIPVEHVSPAHG